MDLHERAKKLAESLAVFESTPEGAAVDLRMDLADLLQYRLLEVGTTQREFAQAVGKRESFVSRVMHADANCTFKVVATLLQAVGVKPKLVDAEEWNRLLAIAEEKSVQDRSGYGVSKGDTNGFRDSGWSGRAGTSPRCAADGNNWTTANLGGQRESGDQERYVNGDADLDMPTSRWTTSRSVQNPVYADYSAAVGKTN